MTTLLKTIIVVFFTLFPVFETLTANDLKVKKIWSNDKYCAFTSLIEFKGVYYCAFREAESHIFDRDEEARGAVRIISSKDGEQWTPVALITKPGTDLRDPKLSITPSGKIMLLMGGSVYKNKNLEASYTQICFSDDGKSFSNPIDAKMDHDFLGNKNWLWNLTWHKNKGYVINYNYVKPGDTRIFLMETSDGISYKIVSSIDLKDFPNEATIRFSKKNEMFVIVRKDAGDRKGYWCSSLPPYNQWNCKQIDVKLGGPDFIFLDNNNFLLGSRCLKDDSKPKTALYLGNKDGNIKELVEFPSGGDNSYPSILKVGKEVWISYYSQHESGNCEIYLAKYPLKKIKKEFF
ncbi:MAG: hypothetical protein Q4F97_02395 [Bacteroidales bacterium]|nr:hypothetical protein [Bacteroidales bacterium]